MALIDRENLKANIIKMLGISGEEYLLPAEKAIWDVINAEPPVQTDEKLEKCRFEYINACRTVTFPTPDTTKKDISDAYAVIKALQPIFGDVPFSNVKRGDSDGTD
jgi:hypothetical protein